MIRLTTNLKGLNVLTFDDKMCKYISDDDCECLYMQLEEWGFGNVHK